MRKYDPLCCYLQAETQSQIVLTYDEIEKIISAKLPHSAYQYLAWWSNHSHDGSQSAAWHNAGYKVEDVVLGDRVVFVKERL